MSFFGILLKKFLKQIIELQENQLALVRVPGDWSVLVPCWPGSHRVIDSTSILVWCGAVQGYR